MSKRSNQQRNRTRRATANPIPGSRDQVASSSTVVPNQGVIHGESPAYFQSEQLFHQTPFPLLDAYYQPYWQATVANPTSGFEPMFQEQPAAFAGSAPAYGEEWFVGQAFHQQEGQAHMSMGMNDPAQDLPPIAGPSRLPDYGDLNVDAMAFDWLLGPSEHPTANLDDLPDLQRDRLPQTPAYNTLFNESVDGRARSHPSMDSDRMPSAGPSSSGYGQYWDQPAENEYREQSGTAHNQSFGGASMDAFHSWSRPVSGGSQDHGDGCSTSAPQASIAFPSLDEYGYASSSFQSTYGPISLPTERRLGEDNRHSVQRTVSFDTPFQAEGYPPVAFGHHVQSHNISIPPTQSQPSGSRAPTARPSKRKRESAAGPSKRKKKANARPAKRSRGPHTEETCDAIGATHAAKRQAQHTGDNKCDQCDARYEKWSGLRRHRERKHNRFLKNFGTRYPCVLCGGPKKSPKTSPEMYHRHRIGRGATRCAVTRDWEPQEFYARLMAWLIQRELAKGKEGKGLECLNHWQFGRGKGTCMRALCALWAEERALRGPLWLAVTGRGWSDKIPIMELVDDNERAPGEPLKKWVKTDEYEPGAEPVRGTKLWEEDEVPQEEEEEEDEEYDEDEEDE